MEARIVEPDRLTKTRSRIRRLAAQADPHAAAQNVAEARELLTLTRQNPGSHDDDLNEAYKLLLGLLLENGDVPELLAHITQLTQQLPSAYAHRRLDWFRCARAVMDGSMDHARILLDESVLEPSAADVMRLAIDWWSGDLGDAEQRALGARRDHPDDLLPLALLARIWAEQGRRAAALGALAQQRDLEQVSDGRNWLLQVSLLAETAVMMGDAAACENSRDALAVHEGRLITMGQGAICWGAVNRPLALLAFATGRAKEAEEYLQALIDAAAYAGAQPWLIQAQLDLAAMYLHTEKFTHTGQLMREVEAGLNSVPLMPLAERYRQFIPEAYRAGVCLGATSCGTRIYLGSKSRAEPRPMPVIHALGGLVVIDTRSAEVAWTSKKARHLLRLLIAKRGVPVTREEAMEFLWPNEDVSALSNRLAVAITAIRKALDPDRIFEGQHFICSTDDTVRLRVDHVTIDVLDFLAAGGSALAGDSRNLSSREADLSRVMRTYSGELFADEPYIDVGLALRHECEVLRIEMLEALVTMACKRSHWQVAEWRARELLALDPCNEVAQSHLAAVLRERKRSSMASGVTSSGPPVSTMRP